MFCIICNYCLQAENVTPQNSWIGGEEEFENEADLVSFFNYFQIKLPLASKQWALTKGDLLFCSQCEQKAVQLVGLNQKLEDLKQELVEIESWVKSRIKSTSRSRNSNLSEKCQIIEDEKLQTVRDLIVGPCIKLTRLPLTQVNNTPKNRRKTRRSKLAKSDTTKNESFVDALTKTDDLNGSLIKNVTPTAKKLLKKSPKKRKNDSVNDVNETESLQLLTGNSEAVESDKPMETNLENFSDLIILKGQTATFELAFLKNNGSDFIIENAETPNIEIVEAVPNFCREETVAEDKQELQAIQYESRDEDYVFSADEDYSETEERDLVMFDSESKIQKSVQSVGLKKRGEDLPIPNAKQAVKKLEGNDRYLYHDKLEFTGNPKEGYQCSQCSNGKRFTNKHGIYLHLRNHLRYPERSRATRTPKNKVKRVEGEEDRYIFGDRLEFTGNDKDGYMCSLCSGWTFPNQARILRHFLIHLRGNNFGRTKCHICNKVLVSPGGLKYHLKSHDDSSAQICEVCGKSCKTVKALGCHMRFNHSKEQFKECDICGKKIRGDEAHLRSHKNTVHLKLTKWCCEFCGKRFSYGPSLQRHLISAAHTSEKQYSCEVCGEQFRQKFSKTTHMRRFHSQPSGLENGRIDSKSTSTDQQPNSEVQESNGDASLKSLLCKFCGMQYHRNCHLTRHMAQIHRVIVKKESKTGKRQAKDEIVTGDDKG